MKPHELSYRDFIKSFENVPRVAISIAILNDEQILLTRRDNSPFKNYWHLPGGFILKGESISNSIKRILKEELGFVNKFTYEMKFISEDLDKDPRGHVIDLIYSVKINEKIKDTPIGYSKEIKYFKKMPKDIGFNHLEVLNRLGFEL